MLLLHQGGRLTNRLSQAEMPGKRTKKAKVCALFNLSHRNDKDLFHKDYI